MEAVTERLETLFDTGIPEDVHNKYLTFYCDRQLYALSVRHVVQIVGMQEITAIPQSPDYFKGIINLRGSMIAVIDTRLRLNKAERDYDERTCIIITVIGGREIGFIVDEVDEVLEIEPDLITQPASATGNQGGRCVAGIANCQGRIILLLEIDKLFTSWELEGLEEI